MKTDNAMRNDENEQGYFLVPKSWLNTIEETQQKILSLLEKGNNSMGPTSIGDYIPETEAKKLLGKKTTWFWQMRTSGRLPFAKVGNKVYYQKTDIIKLLEAGRHDPDTYRVNNAA